MSVIAVEVKGKKPVAVFDVTANVTATPVGAGLLDLVVDLPKAAKKSKFLVLQVVHDEGVDPILGPVAHLGRIMFSIKGGGDDDDDDD